MSCGQPGPLDGRDQSDEDLIDRIRTEEPTGEELEGEKQVVYEDSPGAGLLGAVDDLPEPNEPG